MKIKVIQKIRKETEIDIPDNGIIFDGYSNTISDDIFYQYIYPLIDENGTLITIEGEEGTIYYDG